MEAVYNHSVSENIYVASYFVFGLRENKHLKLRFECYSTFLVVESG